MAVLFHLAVPALQVRVRLVGVGAIDDVGWDVAVDEAGDDADDDNSGQEQPDERIRGGLGGQAGAGEVFLGGGQHAVERRKELREGRGHQHRARSLQGPGDSNHDAGAQAERCGQEGIAAGDLEVLAGAALAQDQVDADDGGAQDAGCGGLAGTRRSQRKRRDVPMPETPLMIHPRVSLADAMAEVVEQRVMSEEGSGRRRRGRRATRCTTSTSRAQRSRQTV